MSLNSAGYRPNVTEIERQMLKHGHTYASLSKKGISPNTIKGMLDKKCKVRRKMDTFRKLGKIFDVPPGTLIEGFISSPIGYTDAVADSKRPRTQTDFVLDEDFQRFANTPEMQQRCNRIAKAVGFRHYIVIIGCVEDNSIRITLDIDEEDAELLHKAIESGKLKRFRVKKANRFGPTMIEVWPTGSSPVTDAELADLLQKFNEITQGKARIRKA